MAEHPPEPSRWRDRRYLVACDAAGAILILVAILTVALVTPSGAGDNREAGAPLAPARVPDATTPIPLVVIPDDLAALPQSTTYTAIEGAPLDPRPMEPTDGTVVHPRREVVVYSAPGGAPIARMGPQQLGDTWLPVIAQQPGWMQVLLPSRPNGSAGWVTDTALDQAVTQYLIRVHLGSFKMELFKAGQRLGEWTVGIGKTSAPTPPGRTFLLGSFTDPKQNWSPIILPLGTHSPTLDTFGGGPGTVALHTWPTADVFGTRSSDGCIRVPPDALRQLTQFPLGTLVLIDEN